MTIEVAGVPPAKSEAKSILGTGHPHAPRVKTLLRAVQDTALAAELEMEPSNFGFARLALEVVVRMPAETSGRSDATNYLGGIADVLESKGHRGSLDHLGELQHVSLYANDSQLDDVRLRFEESDTQSYTVQLWAI
jgi:hypothetical protein